MGSWIEMLKEDLDILGKTPTCPQEIDEKIKASLTS